MALIVLAADKGSPGVTTTAVALAAVWPRRALLAECDPAGGDLVYRVTAEQGGPLDPNQGLISLAATARRGLDADQLWPHVQRLQGGLEVLAGIGRAEQAAGLAGLWPALGRTFDALPDLDVFADCGRVNGESPAVGLMPHAALVLLVARASADQAAHVRDRAVALAGTLHGGSGAAGLGRPPIGVLLVVDPKETKRAVAQVDGLLRASGAASQVVGTIAADRRGAGQLAGDRRGRPDRSLLVRSARQVAVDLHRRFGMAEAGQP
jgi:hypothetical protein